jgi:hypothetical protein
MGGSHTRLFLLATATLLLAGHTEGEGLGVAVAAGPPGCKGLANSPNGPRCVFPFTFKGKTHKGCTFDDSDKPWCATEVDSATGVMVPNR